MKLNMKLIVTVFFLSLFTISFGQETLEESGSWCDGDLQITANLVDGAIVVGWSVDGELLPGEIAPTINCSNYGKGVYSVTLKTGDEETSYEHDLSGIEGPVANFNAKNMLAAAVTYFEDASVSTEEVIAWEWNFGNGETSTEQNPKVMFAEQKVYTITLKVTTASGCTHTITKEHEWAYK